MKVIISIVTIVFFTSLAFMPAFAASTNAKNSKQSKPKPTKKVHHHHASSESHEATTTTPAPTTTTAAPTVRPPPPFCAQVVTLNDVTTGAYIKTACVVTSNKLNYLSASAYCQTNGMYLLAIATSNDYLAVQQILYPALTGLGIGDAWINGVKDASGVYMYDSASGSQPIYTGAIPTNGNFYGYLELYKVSGVWKPFDYGGNNAYPFICEYVY